MPARFTVEDLRAHPLGTISVDQFVAVSGFGRTAAFAAIAAGEIPSIRLGKRIRIPTSWVREQLHVETEEIERVHAS